MLNRLLFNPGPTNVHAEVKAAMAGSDYNHRDPTFTSALTDVCRRLCEVSGGSAHVGVPFAASGTGANEAAIGGLAGPLLVLNAGRYSERLLEIARRLGKDTSELLFDPFEGIEVPRVRAVLKQRCFKALVYAHHETSVGLLAPMAELNRMAHEHGAVTMVDTISSLGGHDIELERDEVDICTVTSNKCLESVPGLSFVIARRSMVNALNHTGSLYLNVSEQWARLQADGMPQFTFNPQLVFALSTALDRLHSEGGVEGRVQRYRRLKAKLRKGLQSMGFDIDYSRENLEANILQCARPPKGFDYRRVRDEMYLRNISIYTDERALARGLVFFATMGAINEAEIAQMLEALREAMLASYSDGALDVT